MSQRFVRMVCLWSVLMLPWLSPARGAHGESAQSLNERGNRLYWAGDYAEALRAYGMAAELQPDSPEIAFNQGNAFTRLGETSRAMTAFGNAALGARDAGLKARSLFSMGNVAFMEAERFLADDLRKALARYGASVHHYREALRVDPGMHEAAENIEIARSRIRDLREEVKRREEEAAKRQTRGEDPREEGLARGDGAPREMPGGKSPDRRNPSPEGREDPGRESGAVPGDEPAGEGKKPGTSERTPEELGPVTEMVQGMLQEERENRLKRLRAESRGRLPVERDW